jgi:hypothetical protein
LGAATIALSRPVSIVPGTEIFERLKAKFSAALSVALSGETLNEKANNIKERTFEWLQQHFPGKFERKRASELTCFVAEGRYSFTEQIYRYAPEVFPDGITTVADKLDDVGQTKPPKGQYDQYGKQIGICIEGIQIHHGDNATKQELESCFIATTVHESLHHFGDLEIHSLNTDCIG